jgi:hypothetical protein
MRANIVRKLCSVAVFWSVIEHDADDEPAAKGAIAALEAFGLRKLVTRCYALSGGSKSNAATVIDEHFLRLAEVVLAEDGAPGQSIAADLRTKLTPLLPLVMG